MGEHKLLCTVCDTLVKMASAVENEASCKKYSGKEEMIDGRRCSFYGSGEKAVIVFQDIFGYDLWLTKLMCEELAKNGYFVALPDIFDGDAWGLDQDMGEGYVDLFVYLKKFPWHTKVKDISFRLMDVMETRGAKTFGCLGFCSGAYLSFWFCTDDRLKCGIAVHPAAQISEPVFGESYEDLTTLIKCPQFLCTADGDSELYNKGGKIYDILDSKFGERNHHKYFPETVHGFLNLGGAKNDEAKLEKDVKEAMEESVVFLNRHM